MTQSCRKQAARPQLAGRAYIQSKKTLAGNCLQSCQRNSSVADLLLCPIANNSQVDTLIN